MQKIFVKREEDSEKGRMKLRLRDWGCAVERCRRTQEELRRLKEIEGGEMPQWKEEYDREKERLENKLQGIWREKKEMDGRIERLEENEQVYIRLRFEKGYGFDYIAARLYMSRATVFRLQDRVLKKLAAQAG